MIAISDRKIFLVGEKRMYLQEQYIMHHIAYEFIQNSKYDILHINEQDKEIWLEKYHNRVSHVIRLTNIGFDWKNELKKDIANVFQKVTNMGKLLVGKHVQIHNIYVSQYPPVDDWEVFRKPIKYKNRKEMNMNVYYVSEQDYEEELTKIAEKIAPVSGVEVFENPYVIQEKLQQYKMFLHNALAISREKVQTVFSYGKPIFTYILMVINIGYFFIVELYGSSLDIPDLIRFGAKYNPLIIDGEWWRIFSSMFLHIGFLHLIMNMLALYYLGTAVERIYGSLRFLFIYIFAGLAAGMASFALTINVSAGASGAIFGLFGALLFFGLHQRKLFLQTMGRGVLFLIGFNIIFGFIAPQIDNSAHLGGLVAGFISSAIVHLPRMIKPRKQFIALIVYSFMVLTLALYGIQNGNNNAMYHLDQIEDLIDREQYEEVIVHAEDALKKSSKDEFELQLYFQRSYAYIKLGEYELAISDLEKSLKINNSMDDSSFNQSEFEGKSYYNLALLHYEAGDTELAEENIRKAYHLNQNDESYIELYEKIIGESPAP